VKPRLLVVTPVHPADDPRIRGKLIASLAPEWDVRYATGAPGPVDPAGLAWVRLPGGRVRRHLRAARLLLAGRYDLASLHDPELLPEAILARLLRRRVVFDLHENLPAQILTKRWVPRLLRRPTAALARVVLRGAERLMPITLAEPGYRTLLRRDHPVFPNYLHDLPDLPAEPPATGPVVYLGDVTVDRGIELAVAALARLPDPPPLLAIGRCRRDLAARLRQQAAAGNVPLELTGYLPHAEALPRVAQARVALSPLLDRPNYRESLPTKILEYLALGVPVVASDLPATRRLATEVAGIRLFPPGNAASLAAAVASVLEDGALQEEARHGAGEIRRRFTWPASDVRDWYRALLD
jgi:glycosyltransferase involved in cell wall biosynthesis